MLQPQHEVMQRLQTYVVNTQSDDTEVRTKKEIVNIFFYAIFVTKMFYKVLMFINKYLNKYYILSSFRYFRCFSFSHQDTNNRIFLIVNKCVFPCTGDLFLCCRAPLSKNE